MTSSTTSDRSLTSTCYDGHVIVTPWAGTRFVPYQQLEQADHHRERVLSYIGIRGMNQLPSMIEVTS